MSSGARQNGAMFLRRTTVARRMSLRWVHPALEDVPVVAACQTKLTGEQDAWVGQIEHCARDFLCGWIEDRNATHVDVVINDTCAEAHTLFSESTQVDAVGAARRRHFVTSLAARLQTGDRVTVRLGTRDLAGSPMLVAGARPPAGSEQLDLRFHVEAPSGPVAKRLCTVSGWATLHAGARELRLLANGHPQNAVFTVRPDVVDRFGSLAAVGWRFTCDVAALEAEGADTLRVTCEVDGQAVAGHDIAISLAPLSRPRPPLHLFMHVPKTAGTSLKTALARQPTLASHWLYHCGPFDVSSQVAALSPRAWQDLDLVGGHFPFGIHHSLGRTCRYSAVLREPLSFLRSYFFYRKEVQRFPPFRNLDIVEAMERRLDHLLDNCFTRFFVGMPPERPVDGDALVEAMSNMERHFEFVGVMERMEESAKRLSRLFGISLELGLENVAPLSEEARAFDVAKIAERSAPFVRYDEQLYRHALKLFWS